VLLLIAVSGQTTCSVSALSNIASNTITMVAGSNGSIQKEYTETIGSSLGMSAVIHTAFGKFKLLFSDCWFPRIMHTALLCSWS